MRLTVRVHPRAGRDEVVLREGGGVDAWLKAAPIDGKANESLCRLLAERLGLRASDVRIVAGQRGRTKIVDIGPE